MLSLKRLTESRAALNAAASYFAFFSTAAYGFLSIPLVVRYLDKEEIGLWAIVSQAVGYLLWMDLGIGVAAGRKLAEAVANEDRIELDSWWTTICTALTVLGLLLLIVGMALIPGFIHFFNVPPPFDWRRMDSVLRRNSIKLAELSNQGRCGPPCYTREISLESHCSGNSTLDHACRVLHRTEDGAWHSFLRGIDPSNDGILLDLLLLHR